MRFSQTASRFLINRPYQDGSVSAARIVATWQSHAAGMTPAHTSLGVGGPVQPSGEWMWPQPAHVWLVLPSAATSSAVTMFIIRT
jgi:hypothetical protein